MKKLLVISLIPVFCIFGCDQKDKNTEQGKDKTITDTFEIYNDNAKVSKDGIDIDLSDISCSAVSDNYKLVINASFVNHNPERKLFYLTNPSLKRESNNAFYTVATNSFEGYLECDINYSFYFASFIPTTIEDENYLFTVDFGTNRITYHLYKTPDQFKEDITVTYKVESTIVHTETIKKGNSVGTNYVYDNDSHQNYADIWKDENGGTFTKSTIVEDSLVVTGQLKDNFSLLTTGTDAYTFVNGINHVPADGKVVIAERYLNKEVCLSNYAIYNNSEVKEVYLPTTLHRIFSNNFTSCSNLTTIYYAGTEEQWNAIQKDFVTIPSSVNLIYNTAFIF